MHYYARNKSELREIIRLGKVVLGALPNYYCSLQNCLDILFCKEMLILDSINLYSNDRVEHNTHLKLVSNYDPKKTLFFFQEHTNLNFFWSLVWTFITWKLGQEKKFACFPGPAKSDFDLLVRFLPEVFITCPYDIYIVNSWKFPLVRTSCGTTWAIRTIDFAAPVSTTSSW